MTVQNRKLRRMLPPSTLVNRNVMNPMGIRLIIADFQAPALHDFLELELRTCRCDAGAACVKMAEAAAASPGNLTLIATGPMTNVALACLVDPSFPHNIGTLHAMGGAEEKGNVTEYAEWNFHCDPEAASLVRFHHQP